MSTSADRKRAEILERLDAAGAELPEAEFDSLMAGVAAAPVVDDGWVDLIAPEAPASLRAMLEDYRAALCRQTAAAFEGTPSRAERLTALRREMAQRNLDVFIVPRTDEYQGEYIPARADRLYWLTGFNGSAGAAAVAADRAAIFVDGRYTLQVRQQVDTGAWTVRHLVSEPVTDWIENACGKGDRIGVDPWLHTRNDVGRLNRAAKAAGAELVRVDGNPVDAVWADQPAAPVAPVRPHDLRFAGRGSAEKREEIAAGLTRKDVAAAVITATDSIAWLLNVRGGDVPHCPLPLSFAVIRDDASVDWFVDARKLAPGLHTHLGNAVTVRAPAEFDAALRDLGSNGARVMADPASAACAVFDALEAGGAAIVEGEDPCLLPKAVKNTVEIDGARAAHRRDGAAVCRFLAWLPKAAAGGTLTEIGAAERLRAFRFEDDLIRDLSFDTISGAGPNGAIVHYRVTPETDRALGEGELYLVDSGGQYLDGTTDITRTVAIGQPSAEMRDRFTRVLKGHIAIATARFPKGVTGAQLDGLARRHLWQVGLDYDHGTGHGVGSYLNVHEGPQRISKGGGAVPLQPGMIVSNEPGFYKTGAFGIRIENLVVVTEIEEGGEGDQPLYGFETLTLAPIDRTLIEPALLTADEKAWLDGYHARVREEIGPLLGVADRAWLEEATRAI